MNADPSFPRLQVALLTGQSVPGSCALSPVQQAFLDRLVRHGAGAWSAIDRNFPYAEATPPYRRPTLLAGSVANARQYLGSRQIAFAHCRGAALTQLIARAPLTVFLAGSCGLELLVNARLSAADLARCRVLAYGPAARTVPDTPTEVVIGTRDWISRRLFACPPQIGMHRIDCDHLGYLEHPAMFAIAVGYLRQAAAELHSTRHRVAWQGPLAL